MGLPTLNEFLTSVDVRSWPNNAYVEYPGMQDLYVRFGPKYIHGVIHKQVLQIANATAVVRGAGTFTRLLFDLHVRGYLLYAENVLNERLAAKLLRMGFAQEVDRVPPSFFLMPTDPLEDK